jgi:2-haloacid dehalogenase
MIEALRPKPKKSGLVVGQPVGHASSIDADLSSIFSPMLSPRPKLLTFDCYGTLIDWDSGIRAYLADLLARKGAVIDPEEFNRHWYYERELKTIGGSFMLYREVLRTSLQEALRDFDIPVEPNDGSDFGSAMERWEPFPESVDVLPKLAKGYELAVISNSQHDLIEHAIAKLGSPFSHVITAEDARAYKPAARPFELALERAGVSAADTLHIAQSQVVDIPRSKAMGIRTVWINRYGERLRPGTPEPDYEFADLRALPGLLGAE